MIDILELLKILDEMISDKNFTYKHKRIRYLKNEIENIHQNKDETILLIKEYYFEITYAYLIYSKKQIPEYLDKELLSFYTNNRKKLHIYNIKELEKQNWSINDIVHDSVKLSAKLIDNYSINEKDLNYWINIRKNNKELFSALVLAGNIIGHIGSIPLLYDEYKSLKEGILEETEFKNQIIDINKTEYLYVPTIVIEKNFRKSQILKGLLIHFFSTVKKLDSLKSIIVNVYSQSGERLSKKMGFVFIGLHNDGGKIYEMDFRNIDKSKLFILKK